MSIIRKITIALNAVFLSISAYPYDLDPVCVNGVLFDSEWVLTVHPSDSKDSPTLVKINDEFFIVDQHHDLQTVPGFRLLHLFKPVCNMTPIKRLRMANMKDGQLLTVTGNLSLNSSFIDFSNKGYLTALVSNNLNAGAPLVVNNENQLFLSGFVRQDKLIQFIDDINSEIDSIVLQYALKPVENQETVVKWNSIPKELQEVLIKNQTGMRNGETLFNNLDELLENASMYVSIDEFRNIQPNLKPFIKKLTITGEINKRREFSEEDLSILKEFANLKKLSILGLDLAKIESIPAFGCLNELFLCKVCNQNDQTFRSQISPMDSLRILSITGCAIESPKQFSGCKNIRSLHLNHINDESKISGLKGFNSLEELCLFGMDTDSLKGFECLENLRKILFGTLSDDVATQFGILGNLKKIEEVCFNSNHLTKSNKIVDYSPLKAIQSIKKIDFGYMKVSDETVKQFGEGWKWDKNICNRVFETH